MADDETIAITVDDTTHPCGSCGEPVPTRQEFCGQCGARQPAVAETAVLDEPTPAPAPEPATVAPVDLAAQEAAAAALVGKEVTFRSLSRRDRELRAEPDPSVAPLPNFVVGRCTVVEARGGWVLLEHSTGAQGWCPASTVKLRGASTASATAAPAQTSSGGLSMIEALERLHALHTAGGLTDEEFTRAKQALLDRG
jgi:hypothetical protein